MFRTNKQIDIEWVKRRTMDEKYWYARGYYDGRTVGVRDDLKELDGEKDAASRLAYKRGYDRGVADYSEMEM